MRCPYLDSTYSYIAHQLIHSLTKLVQKAQACGRVKQLTNGSSWLALIGLDLNVALHPPLVVVEEKYRGMDS
jgi:hypothetical protein